MSFSDFHFTRRTYLKSLATLAATTTALTRPSSAADLEHVRMVVFRPPSLGAFLALVVEHKQFDISNGISIQMDYTTPDNYNTEFAAGHYELGGSAALLSEGLRNAKGVPTTFLFNLFDFWGTIVTHKTDVSSLSDMAGHSLAAATGTTNYAMFTWFSQKAGLDVTSLRLQNATPGGLIAMAIRDRADFVELWEPAYTTLLATDPTLQTISLDFSQWQKTFNVNSIPYLGVAALTDWAQTHPTAILKLYKSYQEASQWVTDNPEEAGEFIAQHIPSAKTADIVALIKANERLGMHVALANTIAPDIKAVLQAGLDIGYYESLPPESIIYNP